MATNLPAFLTKEYLKGVLEKHENSSNINVERFDCAPAVAAGNNYASMLLRAKVHYTKDGAKVEKSLIIKTAASDPEMAKNIEQYGIYQREILMYDRILPQFHKLLESIGDSEQLFSPAICVDVKTSTIIFEDLKTLGFTLADRLTGVDQQHLDLVLRKIAKYHACSMVLYETGSEDFHQFCKPPFTDDETIQLYFNGMCKAFLDQIRTWAGYEEYVKKLEKVQTWLPKELIKVYCETKHPVRVLAHGDLWVNNMMFKYDDKHIPTDLVMLDFQAPYFGAAVNDILYFTITSTIDEIKLHKFPEVMAKYHTILLTCLKQLNYKGKIPTLFELNHQYMEKRFFELTTVLTVLPIILNKEEENAELSNLMTDTAEAQAFKKQIFANEKVTKVIKHFLPIWDKKGLLDPLH